MYSFPSQKELKLLEQFKEPHCVTVYLPYSKPVTTGTNPNYISLKNLIREAEDALKSFGINERLIKKVLRPARELLDSPALDQRRNEGVVMFLHETFSRIFTLPDGNLEPLITVEYGFNLDQLFKVMEDNRKYYLLALAHDNVRLFEGDHYSIAPVQLRNFPSNMKEALHIDEYPKWRETHEIAPSYTGKGSEAVHGQYNVSQVDKDELLEFFRLIDERLHKFLHNKHVPLVLAGVDYLMPIYKKVNSYRYLTPKSIHGNTDHARLTDLQRAAWAIVSTGAIT